MYMHSVMLLCSYANQKEDRQCATIRTAYTRKNYTALRRVMDAKLHTYVENSAEVMITKQGRFCYNTFPVVTKKVCLLKRKYM